MRAFKFGFVRLTVEIIYEAKQTGSKGETS